MRIQKSDVVLSLAGRDQGSLFYVLDTQEGFATLADGKARKVEKPKRKKIKHIQKTNYVDDNIRALILENAYMLDADIVKTLKKYCQVCL